MTLNWNQFVALSEEGSIRMYSEFRSNNRINIFKENWKEDIYDGKIHFIILVIYSLNI